MRESVLFEMTKKQLETGLRDVPVGYCVTSSVDPTKGGSYVGRPISQMALFDPVEVIYLLYFGEPGSKTQIQKFSQELQFLAPLSPETLTHLQHLPHLENPMDLLPMAFLIVGNGEKMGADYRQDGLSFIAKIPQIIATVMNIHVGWGMDPILKPEMGYVENFLHFLKIPEEKTDKLLRLLKILTILYMDHSGGNLSTYVGKTVASGLGNMAQSLSAAMIGLCCPKQAGCSQKALELVYETQEIIGDHPFEIEKLIRAKVENREVIHGFGHSILRVEDPRATFLYNYAQKHFEDHPLIQSALFLRTFVPKILSDYPKITNPYPNIHAIAGPLLVAAGFVHENYLPFIFALSRSIGTAIQISYDRLEARGGKGVPLTHPLYLYRARGL